MEERGEWHCNELSLVLHGAHRADEQPEASRKKKDYGLF
jgi:hypothetical protein